MANKDQENKSNRKDEDKDFGLPEIKITPISSDENKPEPKPKVIPIPSSDQSERKGEGKEAPKKDYPKVADSEKPKEEPKEPVSTPVGPKTEAPKPAKSEDKKEKEDEKVPAVSNQYVEKEKEKSSKAWLIILLIFLLGIIGFSIYYFQGQEPEKEVESVLGKADEPVVIEQPRAEEEPEEIVTEKAEEAVAGTPEMTEISEKGENPRYLVTVGAFIDGDLAKDFSDRLNKKGYNTFLVLPGYGSSFYKLAIADFDNVVDATAMIEKEQGNFEETLWVFKY